MISISGTDTWRTAHPGARIGFLEVSGAVQVGSAGLEARKREIEASLRERYVGFTRANFLALPVMAAYDRYYRRFDKTYHVLQQVESLVLKGRNLPNVAPLVDANYMAEVDSLVLTASHDADKLEGAIWMDTAQAGDEMTQMNGTRKPALVGDMLMRDAHGVCCSIIYGQDNLSMLTPDSTHALYVAYAPAGVMAAQVLGHLDMIWENIRLFCPATVREQQFLLEA